AVDQKFLQDIKPREEFPAFYAALYEFIARVTAGRLQATSRRVAELELEIKTLRAELDAKEKVTAPVRAAAKRPATRTPALAKAKRAVRR
ncbi:MAG: hypothetical protein ACOYMN_13975, partial [Roseimicrobium sp.]